MHSEIWTCAQVYGWESPSAACYLLGKPVWEGWGLCHKPHSSETVRSRAAHSWTLLWASLKTEQQFLQPGLCADSLHLEGDRHSCLFTGPQKKQDGKGSSLWHYSGPFAQPSPRHLHLGSDPPPAVSHRSCSLPSRGLLTTHSLHRCFASECDFIVYYTS